VNPDDIPLAPNGRRQETVSEAFADYLRLVEETIRTRVTDADIRDRVRGAMERAVTVQRGVAEDRVCGEDAVLEHRLSTGEDADQHAEESRGLPSRREVLDTLMALARGPRPGPAVLAGPGGVGKTTLATTVANRVKARGNQVWWVSALDPVTLSQGLAAVARQLGGSGEAEAVDRGAADAADRFWLLLDRADPGWLLVFDEADDPRVLAAGASPAGVQDLTGWVRSSARGLALVTSRRTDPWMWRAARLLTIGQLHTDEAAQVLLELAPSAGNQDQAKALAHGLGRHPLNLRLAGEYLRSRAAQQATFVAYERALSEQAGTEARDHPGSRSIRALTACAVKLSLDGLARQGLPQARPVLQLASFYASTAIPASLLNADSLSSLFGAVDDTSPTAHDTANEVLLELERIGLVERSEGEVVLHAAVTEASRADLDGPDPAAARIRHTAVELLAASAARLSFDQPEAWPQYLRLGPHLLSLLGSTAEQVDREHLRLLMETAARMANAFNHAGASQAGTVLCSRALEHRTALGEEDRAVLRVRHHLAWAIAYNGGLEQAEAQYRDVYQIRLRTLGAEDEDVLDSRHELAWIAGCRRDWAMAEQGYRDALDQSLRILDPEDPKIMLTRHELAWAIANRDQHRLDEAREIFRTVLADRRRLLGPEHPRTLTTQHELAWIAARKSEWENAETTYRGLLAARLQVLGEDHPDTLVTRHELAWIAARRGRFTEAEARYADVMDDRRRILGDDHPQTHATQEALDELRRGRIVDAQHLA
jgi:hypothetical protein